MNIIDIQDDLKNLPEQALMQEMQRPTGSAPQFLVLGELKRRKQMRDDYKRQQNSDMKTVAEEVVTAAGAPQEGIMQMARSLNPNTNMAQDTGLAQATPVTPTQAPQPQAPQMMSGGGIMRLQDGGGPLLGSLSPAALELSLDGSYGPDVQNEAVSKAIMGLYGPEMQSDIIAKAISGSYGTEVQQKAESLMSGSPTTGSDVGSGFGSNIEYTYNTYLDENSLNDSPQAREMFSNYKSYMDTRDPPSNPQLFSAMNFDEGPQGLASVSPQTADFMPNSGELTRPELSLSPQILNELSVEPDAAFTRQTSPAEQMSTLDQLRSSVYSNNPLENALKNTGLNSNVIGDYIVDPITGRIEEIFAEDAARNERIASGDVDLPFGIGSDGAESTEVSPEPMQSQTAADIANETALRNREMASENAGRLTAEELLAPTPEAYDVTDTRFDNVPTPGVRPSDTPRLSESGFRSSSIPELNVPDLEPIAAASQTAESDFSFLDMFDDLRGAGSGYFDARLRGMPSPNDAAAVGGNLVEQESSLPMDTGEQLTVPSAEEGGIGSLLPPKETSEDKGADKTTDTVASTDVGSSGRIAQMLEDRQKSAESDKWMALAQTGLALMASDQPTLGGAIGEAGLAGIGALQQSRQGMQDFEMDMLKLQTQIDAANRKSSSKGGLTAGNIISYVDDLARQQSDVRDKLDELETGVFMGTEEQKEAIRKRLQTNLFQVGLELSTYRNALRGGQPSSGSSFDVTGGSQSTGN
tara:strand:+ start:1379 stop:3640 length:2262 start_codon:yes stop_codon:yes gene_type:complete